MKLSLLLLSLALFACRQEPVSIQTQDYEIHHAYGVVLPVDNPKGIITAREAIFYANHISFIDFVFESKDLRVKGKHAIMKNGAITYENAITEYFVTDPR